jgi:hypothetical protein
MRIKRTVIIPTILALCTAGSALVGSAVPLMAAQASSTQVLAAAPALHPMTHYYG